MATQWRIRKKLMRTICPFDETVSLLKGGLQKAPKWFNSVRKYPPSVLWMTPGCVPRPHRFWDDKVRNLALRNKERPDWVPNVHEKADSTDPLIADAFTRQYRNADPDVEFASCQHWFMSNKGMDEDAAYRQAKYKMRNLIAQKQRIWEVYHRKRFGVPASKEMSTEELCRKWADKLEKDMVDTKRGGIMTKRLNREGTPIRRRAGMTERFRRFRIIQSKVLTELRESSADEIVDRAHASADAEKPTDYFTGEALWHDTAQDLDRYKSEVEKEIRRVALDDERQRSIEKVRLAEYTRLVQRNPQLGVGDPVALLDGLEEEAREKLFSAMASRRLPEGYDAKASFAKSTVATGVERGQADPLPVTGQQGARAPVTTTFEVEQYEEQDMLAGDFEAEAYEDEIMETTQRVETYGIGSIQKEEIWELEDDEFYSLLRDSAISDSNKDMITAWRSQMPDELSSANKNLPKFSGTPMDRAPDYDPLESQTDKWS